jgi:diguanylate cyclase (GGDEF)-like protein
VNGFPPDFRNEKVMRIKNALKKIIVFTGLMAGVGIIGVIDFLTGSEYAFSIFYFFPILLAAWYAGLPGGLTLSIESAFVWYFADVLARTPPYPSPLIPAWNTGVRFATFLTVSILLHLLHNTLHRETLFARIDYLTEAANTRAFYEAVESQISVLKRRQRPFTVLYLDLDNLKELNDAFGHSTGDKVLRATVTTLKRVLRPNDTIGRLGGDEFAVLLPEADARGAEIVATRVQSALRRDPGGQHQVTYSIGALTCTVEPKSVDELIAKADNLMYEAKRTGKDRVRLGSNDLHPPAEV